MIARIIFSELLFIGGMVFAMLRIIFFTEDTWKNFQKDVDECRKSLDFLRRLLK